MRLNPWLNAENHERELNLLGYFGHKGNTQNTVLCLFEPDAPGLQADSFPTHEAVYFGTRPGRRYVFLDMGKDALTANVKKWHGEQTGGAELGSDLLERMVHEYQVARDGDGLARVMQELAARHPGQPEAADSVPHLPVMPDLMQALNIAAADTRGVIVAVHPPGGDQVMEQRLARLVFEQGIAGRTHVARLTAAEWAAARESGQITGGTLAAGVVFVAPDPFGLDGEVWAEVGPEAGLARMRKQLRAAVERFRREWRKPDRKTHLRLGAEGQVVWSEYDPDRGCVAPIPIEGPEPEPEPESPGEP